MKSLGLRRALIVHGDDGLDEITTTTTTSVCELRDGNIKTYKLNPEEYGIKLADSEDIKGGSPKENAEIIKDILKGKRGPQRDIVILNSAAALYAAEIVNSLDEGIKKAQELIDSGRAYKKYEELTAC